MRLRHSGFACIAKLAPRKDCKIPEAYLAFAAEFPTSPLAEKALFNAGVGFFSCKSLDRAIGARRQLIEGHPQSELIPKAIAALAEDYEATANFESAAAWSERYAARYEQSRAHPRAGQRWEESTAQTALFNAGIFRDGLGEGDQALVDRQKYLRLWPDSADSDAVFLSIVELQEHGQHWALAIKQLERYEKGRAAMDPDRVLAAQGRIATFYETKLNNLREARKTFEKILEFWDRLPKQSRSKLAPASLEVVARAHFAGGEDEWKKFERLKLKWAKFERVAELRSSILEKSRALSAVQKRYTATIGFKAADPAICALYRIGLAYDEFSEAMSNVPIPADAPAEMGITLRSEFGGEGDQLRAKAAEAFTAAVEKSNALSPFNPCRQTALDRLRRQNPAGPFPKMGEDRKEMTLEGFKSADVGDDLLTAIQL